jgi:hypothetical protein
MRRFVSLLVLVACGGSSHEPVPPKRPNNELIIDTFERRPPNGTTAMRFRADGSVDVAHDKDKLDRENLAHGTWQLDRDQLTLSYDTGMCAGGGSGVYQVVLSKLGIHFKKVSDSCDQRAKIDGEVWRRVKRGE